MHSEPISFYNNNNELKEETAEFRKILENDETLYLMMNIDEIESNPQFEKLNSIFEAKLSEIEKRGNTCKLWIQYFRMVSLLKKFVSAEKMGNWDLHLDS